MVVSTRNRRKRIIKFQARPSLYQLQCIWSRIWSWQTLRPLLRPSNHAYATKKQLSKTWNTNNSCIPLWKHARIFPNRTTPSSWVQRVTKKIKRIKKCILQQRNWWSSLLLPRIKAHRLSNKICEPVTPRHRFPTTLTTITPIRLSINRWCPRWWANYHASYPTRCSMAATAGPCPSYTTSTYGSNHRWRTWRIASRRTITVCRNRRHCCPTRQTITNAIGRRIVMYHPHSLSIASASPSSCHCNRRISRLASSRILLWSTNRPRMSVVNRTAADSIWSKLARVPWHPKKCSLRRKLDECTTVICH